MLAATKVKVIGSEKKGTRKLTTEPIAEMLLKTVFKSVFFQQEEQQQPIPVVCIDTFSEKGKQLALRLQGKIVFNLAYMTTKGVVPKACFDKWFGATAVEIG